MEKIRKLLELIFQRGEMNIYRLQEAPFYRGKRPGGQG